MKRTRLLLALLAISLLASFAVAQAGSVRKPPLGAWQFGSKGTGFTLKKGKGRLKAKVFVSNIHYVTPAATGSCPDKSVPVKVLGRFPIKTFTRGGYTTWGVGKNTGGDVTPMPGKVRAGGKTYNGTFYIVWDYSNYSRTIGGSIEFGNCLSQMSYGSHVKR